MADTYTQAKQQKSGKGEAVFEAQVPIEAIEAWMRDRIREMAATFTMPGFRKGNVPLDVVRAHSNEQALLEDAVDMALRDAIHDMVHAEKLSIIGSPHITVESLSAGKPVSFTVRFALFPKIDLPDYKKIGHAIASEAGEATITDKELQDAIDHLRKSAVTPESDETLPELTDAFVQRFGPFENVEAFKKELLAQLTENKTISARQETREKIIEAIVKNATLEIPELFIEQELDAFAHNREEELKRAGISFEEYLKETGKNAEAFAAEERELVKERVKSQLVLQEIQEKEQLAADEKELMATAARLAVRYPDRDKEDLYHLAQSIILQEKLFDLLEGKTPAPLPEKKD